MVPDDDIKQTREEWEGHRRYRRCISRNQKTITVLMSNSTLNGLGIRIT